MTAESPGAPADLPADLVAVAERLRAHPDVMSGPSVRAVLATADVHAALGAVLAPGGGRPRPPHLALLMRAALLALPHRLRVRAGADAEQIVRDAVLAVGAPGPADPPGRHAPPDRPRGAGAEARPVFTLAADGGGTGGPPSAATDAAGRVPEVDSMLDDLLRPARRGTLADGRTPTPRARPPGGERSAPAPLRPGDHTRDLSVRATLRAALRAGIAPSDVLRVRPPRPDVSLDVVLALDVSASMLGAGIAPLARALVGGLTRAGHRVGLQVFAAGTTRLCGLTRDPAELLHAAAAYTPENPTNLEVAIWSAHDLLARSGSRSRAGVVLVVTDAEPTVCGTPGRRPRGFGSGPSRVAALVAAAQARAAGVTVSVLCPPPGAVARVDLAFGARLAAAGGGRARCYPAAAGPAVQGLPGDQRD